MNHSSYEQLFPQWFTAESYSKLNIAATYNLVYNGTLFVKEGLGICLIFSKLVSTEDNEGLTFRPLTGVPKASLKLIWRKNNPLSPQANVFLEVFKREFALEPTSSIG